MSSRQQTYRIGDCFEFEGHRYRYVAQFETPERHIFVVDLDERKPLPIKLSGSQLDRFTKKTPTLRKLDRLIRDISTSEYESDLTRENERYAIVKELTKRKELYDEKTRTSVLNEYAVRAHKTKETVLAWVRQFWTRSATPQALRSSYDRSGRVTESTPGALVIHGADAAGPTANCFAPEAKKSRGASPLPRNALVRPKRTKEDPRNDLPPRYSIYPIPHDEIKQIIVIAWRHYRTAHFKSMHGATKAVIADMFTERDEHGMPVVDEDGNCKPRPLGERPTYRQVKRLVDKVKSKSQQYRARFGDASFLNNVAARFGNKRDDCVGPSDVGEIDATKLDVNCVDQATRTTIIGKPILILVVDRWSNLIIGWHLTLDNPSWAEAKFAILSIFDDWRKVGQRMGIAVHQSDVIANGRMPSRLFADRGDLFHKGPEQLCSGFETDVTNAPPLISVAKGLVESLFRTLMLAFRDESPGYDPPEEHGKRRVAARAKTTVYTFPALQKLIFHRILTHNRSQLKNYSPTPKEIMLDLPISPLDIFDRDSQVLTGSGSDFEYDYAKRQLMTRSAATVTADGIKFGHCTYQANEIKEWCVVARLTKSFDVNIAYETNSVDEIAVFHPKDSSITFNAKLVSADRKKWAGYSHAERHYAFLVDKMNRRNNSDVDTAISMQDFLYRAAVTKEESEATALAIETISYAKRLSDGPAALELERRSQRGKTAAVSAPRTHKELTEPEASPRELSRAAMQVLKSSPKGGSKATGLGKGALDVSVATEPSTRPEPREAGRLRRFSVPNFGAPIDVSAAVRTNSGLMPEMDPAQGEG